MESLDSSIEPSTLCSAALSCGGVRSPGRLGRSPGSYVAGPSPQSSRGGSGEPGTSHDPCSVMLTDAAPSPRGALRPRGPVHPTDVTGVTLGIATDSAAEPPRAGASSVAPDPPRRESRRP